MSTRPRPRPWRSSTLSSFFVILTLAGVATLVTALQWSSTTILVPPDWVTRCFSAADGSPRSPPAVTACIRATQRRAGWASAVGVLILLFVALFAEWTRAATLARRRRLLPLQGTWAALAESALDEVGHGLDAGTGRPVTYLLSTRPHGASPYAFASRGRGFIAIDPKVLAAARSDPDQFRGLVRHELAHLVRRDAAPTQRLRMLIAVSMGAAAAGIAVTVVDEPSLGPDMALRLGGLAVVALVLHRTMLQLREHGADRLAVRDDAHARAGLERRLKEDAMATPTGRARQLIRLHPSPTLRVRALTTDAAVPQDMALAVGAGIVLTASHIGLSSLVTSLVAGPTPGVLAHTVDVVGWLVGGVVSVLLVRLAEARRNGLVRRRAVVGIVLGVSAGAALGQVFAPGGTVVGAPADALALGGLVALVGHLGVFATASAAAVVVARRGGCRARRWHVLATSATTVLGLRVTQAWVESLVVDAESRAAGASTFLYDLGPWAAARHALKDTASALSLPALAVLLLSPVLAAVAPRRTHRADAPRPAGATAATVEGPTSPWPPPVAAHPPA